MSEKLAGGDLSAADVARSQVRAGAVSRPARDITFAVSVDYFENFIIMCVISPGVTSMRIEAMVKVSTKGRGYYNR